MVTYEYRCSQCGHDTSEDHPIGSARTMRQCPACGGVMRRLYGSFHIGAGALPNKRSGVLAIERDEREMGVDRPAYQRLRKKGIQPPNIQGSAQLEDQVGEQFDITYGDLISPEYPKERIKEVLAESQETFAVANNGLRVGKR